MAMARMRSPEFRDFGGGGACHRGRRLQIEIQEDGATEGARGEGGGRALPSWLPFFFFFFSTNDCHSFFLGRNDPFPFPPTGRFEPTAVPGVPCKRLAFYCDPFSSAPPAVLSLGACLSLSSSVSSHSGLGSATFIARRILGEASRFSDIARGRVLLVPIGAGIGLLL